MLMHSPEAVETAQTSTLTSLTYENAFHADVSNVSRSLHSMIFSLDVQLLHQSEDAFKADTTNLLSRRMFQLTSPAWSLMALAT